MFRPATMNWVDLLVDRDSVSNALDVLARLRIIELRQYDRGRAPFEVSPDESVTGRLAILQRELESARDYLPAPDPETVPLSRRHAQTHNLLPELEHALRGWINEATPIIAELNRIDSRLEELQLLKVCLDSVPEGELDPSLLSDEPSRWFTPFLVIATEDELNALGADVGNVVLHTYPVQRDNRDDGGPKQAVLLNGVTEASEVKALERRLHGLGMRFVRVPAGLDPNSRQAARQVQTWTEREEAERARLLAALNTLNQRSQTAGWVWLLNRHRWVNEALATSLLGQRFVWLGGWVPAARYPELVDALQSSGIPFLVNSEAATGHGTPPVKLDNPSWVRRFEAFVTGFGVPAVNEVDPTPMLAILAPLMFGYMFGDVGQGLVLAVIGWVLRNRLPVLGLLVPGGISAVLFGFLYGSVFCDEHLLQPIWLRPMDEPLSMLLWPMGFGLAVIFLSMILGAFQAYWRGQRGQWWSADAPVVGLLVGLSLGIVSIPAAAAVGLASLVWSVAAAGVRGYRRHGAAGLLSGAAKNLVELIEITAQLVINTVSFVRLGAFALAHAGLGAAVIALSAIPDHWLIRIGVFLLGNLVVITLEGLVVAIQTTRLVMFEFFRRFLIGSGRQFRPLEMPDGGDCRSHSGSSAVFARMAKKRG